MPDDPPEGYNWATRDMLRDAPLQEFPEHQFKTGELELTRLNCLPSFVDQFFTNSGAAMRVAPWEKRGWYKLASSWVCSKLKDTKFAPTELPTRVSGSSECIVLSVGTISGRKVFFKAQKSSETWRYYPSEALITAYLSRLFSSSLIPMC